MGHIVAPGTAPLEERVATAQLAAEQLTQKLTQQILLAGQAVEFFLDLLKRTPRGTGPELLLRDLITTGTIPPRKIAILETLNALEVRRLSRRIEEWAKEIDSPGTGQPAFAVLGVLPEEAGALQPSVEVASFGARRGKQRTIRRLADGSPLLELPGRTRRIGFRSPAELGPFQRKAAELRRLAQRRGLI